MSENKRTLQRSTGACVPEWSLAVGDFALVFGASIRLTRLITTDVLGDTALVSPLSRWALAHDGKATENKSLPGDNTDINLPIESVDSSRGWRSYLVSALDCPFCVGTWIGYGVIGSYVLALHRPTTLKLWRAATAGLALNYVTGHVSAAID